MKIRASNGNEYDLDNLSEFDKSVLIHLGHIKAEETPSVETTQTVVQAEETPSVEGKSTKKK